MIYTNEEYEVYKPVEPRSRWVSKASEIHAGLVRFAFYALVIR